MKMKMWHTETGYGIFNWIDSHTNYKLTYIILAALFFCGGIVLCAVYSLSWWAYLIIPVHAAWVSPFVIYVLILVPIALLEQVVWGILHPKRIYKGVFLVLGIVVTIFVGGLAAVASVQYCAETFAKPNPKSWGDAYVSESPNVKTYHHDEKCKYIQQSRYDYKIMSIDDAEYKYDLEPCQYCLQKNLKHQYNEAIPFVAILYYVIIYFTSKRVAAIFQKS